MHYKLPVEEIAKHLAGNWKRFESFCWHRRYGLDRSEDWTVVYTHTRDSALLDLSNAGQIAKAMAPFTKGEDPDAVEESHNHWACGWVAGLSVRVYQDGAITDAFRVWCGIQSQLEDYPVLDEEDYSRAEYEATLENIATEGGSLDYEFPDGWEGEVFSWLWDHNQRAVENRDDQGGYPSREEIQEACEAMGWAYLGEPIS